jgi:YesN/AraC family two-component response regulator
METLQGLWVDLTVGVQESELAPSFRQSCKLTYCSGAEHLKEIFSRSNKAFDFVCFDYDYPDRNGLQLIRSTKVSRPSLPIVMFTVQHSEALSIWAFRTKVWDYLVKPVANQEAERCLATLLQVCAHKEAQPIRKVISTMDKIPQEILFAPIPDDCSLAPALEYIERNFRAPIRAEDVAASCGLNQFRFSRLFKETFGLTFQNYLINYRLREACRLLENPRSAVGDVGFAVGFQDPAYFSRIFKQRLGLAPSALVGQKPSIAIEQVFEALPKIAL